MGLAAVDDVDHEDLMVPMGPPASMVYPVYPVLKVPLKLVIKAFKVQAVVLRAFKVQEEVHKVLKV